MKSILIIDDDPDMRDALSYLLVEEGYTVRVAASGQQGLTMAQEELPSIILLDWHMPQMGGEQVLLQLAAATPALKSVSVILMSANINHIPEEYLRFRNHISKPFEIEVLLKTLKQIIGTYNKSARKKGEA